MIFLKNNNLFCNIVLLFKRYYMVVNKYLYFTCKYYEYNLLDMYRKI